MTTTPKIFHLRIVGKSWRLRVLNREQYNKKKTRSGSVAITYVHKRRIDLSPEGCDKETIIHELVHAYLYEMCVHSADLDADAIEEFFAELMAKRGQELLNLAQTLFERISKKVGTTSNT